MSVTLSSRSTGPAALSSPESHGVSEEKLDGRKRKFATVPAVLEVKKAKQAKSKHVKDCRRYRDKMTKKFEELTQTIPGAASDSTVNHRAKVIDHTMRVLQQLLEETRDLQLQLAMTDKRRMSKWIEKVVSNVHQLDSAVEPLMNLLLDKRSWKYAEFWKVEKAPGGSVPSLEMTKHRFNRDLNTADHAFFDQLRNKHAAEKVQPESGLLRRAFETMCGQFMRLDASTRVPMTANLQAQSLEMCLAVPIIVLGHVKGIVAFYDHCWRTEEATDGLALAEEIATMTGNVFGSCSREQHLSQSKRVSENSSLTLASDSDSNDGCSDTKRTSKGAILFLLNA